MPDSPIIGSPDIRGRGSDKSPERRGMGNSPSSPKLKASIDGSISRLKIKAAQAKNQARKERGEITILLQGKGHPTGDDVLARIRAEALYQTDQRSEAMAIVEQQLEVLRLRVPLLLSEKDCPRDLVSILASILYAVDRLPDPVAELTEVRAQLQMKYPSAFLLQIARDHVHPRLVEVLALTPPSSDVVTKYLEEIAASSGVQYTPPAMDPVSRSNRDSNGGGGGAGVTGVAVSPLPAPSSLPQPPQPQGGGEIPQAVVVAVLPTFFPSDDDPPNPGAGSGGGGGTASGGVSGGGSGVDIGGNIGSKGDPNDIAARLAALRKS